MPRNTSQLSRLFCWRYLRWALAVPALPLALWACNSHPLQQPQPSKQQETDFEVAINPQRSIDILFMVDNSPSMEQEQANLAKNFKLMIDQLKDPTYGLPDVHLAVVDSDVGSGNVPCNFSNPGGDWGLLWGNPDDDHSDYANVTKRRDDPDSGGCGLVKSSRWIEDIQNGKQKNYTGDISQVFGCIANVGTEGCGYEHQLRAVEVALTGQPNNLGFLRDDAYLAIILVTDEDDCSADQGTDMFGVTLKTESASLRCATRGHTCDGKEIPYYDKENGFNPPSVDADNVGFKAPFKSCAPRTDKDLPLLQVDYFIDKIKALKERPDDQIIVAGIYGWPMPGKEDTAEYKIGKDPNPDMASMKDLWDYLPICESPGLGKAYGGLRLRKFVDAFKGDTFPICQGNLEAAMAKIGETIAKKIIPGCVDYWLVDTDSQDDGVQAECQVIDRIPVHGDPQHPWKETAIPQCDAGKDNKPCWWVKKDPDSCPKTGQRIWVERPIDDSTGQPESPPAGTMLAMKCLTCPDSTDQKLCPH